MNCVEARILADGIVSNGDVLSVDSFLNHQIDVTFLNEVGKEFYERYKNSGVNKILTVEASGIGIACIAAQFFSAPVVFAKKSKSSNIAAEVYTAPAESYTHGGICNLIVSKNYLHAGDRVLLIDDFLAKGNALKALISIVEESGAEIVGAGIVIEKAYQGGGDEIRAAGVRVESLAKIASMDVEEGIRFCH